MADSFKHDVFLSHSAKDQAILRDLAERLRADGLKVFQFRISEFGFPRRCMSANAFASDSAQSKSGTLRFRDPLNKERRFLPLHFDNAPIQQS